MREDGSAAGLRRALIREGLAFDEFRAALAGAVRLRPIEALAVQYLAHAGALTPSELATRLALSSSGNTALLQRLDRAGSVLRDAHPSDRRNVLQRVAPEIDERLDESLSALVEEIDEATAELTAEERRTVVWFLDRVAELSEEYSQRLRRLSGHPASDAADRPPLWA